MFQNSTVGVQPCWNVRANIKRQTWKESEHKISMWVKNGYKKILIISQRRWTIMTHNLTTAIQTHPRWKECSSLCCKPQTLQWSQGILTWAKSDIGRSLMYLYVLWKIQSFGFWIAARDKGLWTLHKLCKFVILRRPQILTYISLLLSGIYFLNFCGLLRKPVVYKNNYISICTFDIL